MSTPEIDISFNYRIDYDVNNPQTPIDKDDNISQENSPTISERNEIVVNVGVLEKLNALTSGVSNSLHDIYYDITNEIKNVVNVYFALTNKILQDKNIIVFKWLDEHIDHFTNREHIKILLFLLFTITFSFVVHSILIQYETKLINQRVTFLNETSLFTFDEHQIILDKYEKNFEILFKSHTLLLTDYCKQEEIVLPEIINL